MGHFYTFLGSFLIIYRVKSKSSHLLSKPQEILVDFDHFLGHFNHYRGGTIQYIECSMEGSRGTIWSRGGYPLRVPFWVIFDHFGVILIIFGPRGGHFDHFGGGGGYPPPGGGIFVHFGVKKWHTKAPPLVVQLFGHFHRGFLRTVFGG